MPLPTDEAVVQTSRELVAQLHSIFGEHPGFRPAHAKGILLSGAFTPSAEAAKLSVAPQFNNSSTAIIIRHSNSTGVPSIPDIDPNADPRGLAIRFTLGDHVHTDIIAHSTPFFPVRTGQEFLEFLRAAAESGPGAASPSPIEKFLGSHPSALAFVQAPKPPPSSYAREAYFGVNAFKLVDAAGKATFIRYRVIPDLGVEKLSPTDLATKGANYLQEDLTARLANGPLTYRLLAQIAEEGDVTNDATVHWPETRKLVELGQVKVEKAYETEKNVKDQKNIIFDPIPRVKGVEPSDDPLLDMRASVYLVSGRERRAAP
ncbi:catalase-like domain-containing protein [Gymnopilus junonius]|uniref:Catalase-like domain-containing protein n=1 Tax=Gymnopilus junonius TaxID=109634 RepID=A0A9P5TLP4_GYMJU|nr:catalase-like domain-containing protein [Gymnopilus junonius]